MDDTTGNFVALSSQQIVHQYSTGTAMEAVFGGIRRLTGLALSGSITSLDGAALQQLDS